ncbi:YeeE/YedE thiosulfate transporter family protein [Tenacibaculum tangerinum]|uniref:YeeE/YedE thiosulfate transporter family protein n=1 Tax=Tenacibaculum tangerinum TaxID=3038772 RepID=A0ABY8L2M2_9FLAO|nr:YeeE/YedE thiosulfate transporter family protein [Tenacibaculum tangerinum]WGH74355.1 YeeE/YedE thiosulfate transporter family protein [Tenacibaculum tangerinum]
MDFILQPWPWFVSGPLIAIILFLFFHFGKNFGVSANLETICTMAGAGKVSDYFKKDWKERDWAIVFLVGLTIGGYIAVNYLSVTTEIDLNPITVNELADLGFADAGKTYVPNEIFSIENMQTLKGFAILLIAGILIGFGTRYADGCTSGHAITGLSSFQLPSLIAVIGFFIGGLVMTWILFPLIFG